ncbi:hypothetical protein JKG47_11635 [Acidithiobacillus sp. MC6.1]|nr:hypothetical protein [Acidithiobacillus sp. MC6.1]
MARLPPRQRPPHCPEGEKPAGHHGDIGGHHLPTQKEDGVREKSRAATTPAR